MSSFGTVGESAYFHSVLSPTGLIFIPCLLLQRSISLHAFSYSAQFHSTYSPKALTFIPCIHSAYCHYLNASYVKVQSQNISLTSPAPSNMGAWQVLPPGAAASKNSFNREEGFQQYINIQQYIQKAQQYKLANPAISSQMKYCLKQLAQSAKFETKTVASVFSPDSTDCTLLIGSGDGLCTIY